MQYILYILIISQPMHIDLAILYNCIVCSGAHVSILHGHFLYIHLKSHDAGPQEVAMVWYICSIL